MKSIFIFLFLLNRNMSFSSLLLRSVNIFDRSFKVAVFNCIFFFMRKFSIFLALIVVTLILLFLSLIFFNRFFLINIFPLILILLHLLFDLLNFLISYNKIQDPILTFLQRALQIILNIYNLLTLCLNIHII